MQKKNLRSRLFTGQTTRKKLDGRLVISIFVNCVSINFVKLAFSVGPVLMKQY
jgi:hypothetical protein